MKKILANKKIIVFGILLGLVGVMIWLRVSQKQISETEPKKAEVITQAPKQATPPFTLPKPGEIVWGVDKIEGLKEKSFECKYKSIDISKTTENLAKLMQLEKKEGLGNLDLYSDKSGWITVYGDKTEKTVAYQKDWVGLKMGAVDKKDWVTEELMVTKLVDIWDKLMPQDLKTKVVKINYQLADGVRLVTEKKDMADLIEIEANWTNDGDEVISMLGSLVIARFRRDGELVSLKTVIPNMVGTKDCQEVSLLTLEEVLSLKANKYQIIDVTGGKEFDKSDQDEVIAKMTVTKAEMVYLWDQYQEVMRPEVKIEGNTLGINGPVVVTAVANIVK